MLQKQVEVLKNALDMAMASATQVTVQRSYFEQLKQGWNTERIELLAKIKKLEKQLYVYKKKPTTKTTQIKKGAEAPF